MQEKYRPLSKNLVHPKRSSARLTRPAASSCASLRTLEERRPAVAIDRDVRGEPHIGARATLRKHRDNLWVLGGEIISKLHENPRLRKQPMADVVFAALDDEGGPLLSHHV
jgi:hypothetical protein